jgi:hypothetical protein
MHRTMVINSRLVGIYVPQTLPVLQLALDALLIEYEPAFDSLDAKVEILFVIFSLWQSGHLTSSILLLLNTSVITHRGSHKSLAKSMMERKSRYSTN